MKLELCCELSANHLGDFRRAMQIVDAAADAGADLFKVQVWSPGTMCLDRAYKLTSGPWKGRTLFDLYEEAWTPWAWLPDLFAHVRKRGMIPFGAAFDRESVDYLESLHVDRHKIASFELTDLPLIRYMASKGKPMILSTGMATLDEMAAAYRAAMFNVEGLNDITLLRCTSAYPADPADANLRVPPNDKWGLSDHSMGIGVSVAAAALGATYIEKHLTLSRKDGGPDAGFSMEPAEFKQLVTECRNAAAAVGTVRYGPGPNESTELRRSLYVYKDTAKGEKLILNGNVRTARPAKGLPPGTDISRAYAARGLLSGEPLTSDCIA
jgi:sialic acid synthase SpsE